MQEELHKVPFGLKIYESISATESTYEVTFPDSQYVSVKNVLSDYPFNKKRVITNNLRSALVYFKGKQGHLQWFVNFQGAFEFFSLGFLLWFFFFFFLMQIKMWVGKDDF